MAGQIASFAYGIAFRLALLRIFANNLEVEGLFIGVHDSLRLGGIIKSSREHYQSEVYRYRYLAIYYLIEFVLIQNKSARIVATLVGWVVGLLIAEVGPGLWNDLQFSALVNSFVLELQADWLLHTAASSHKRRVARSPRSPQERSPEVRASLDERNALSSPLVHSAKKDDDLNHQTATSSLVQYYVLSDARDYTKYKQESVTPGVEPEEDSPIPGLIVIAPSDTAEESQITPKARLPKLKSATSDGEHNVLDPISDGPPNPLKAQLEDEYDADLYPSKQPVETADEIVTSALEEGDEEAAFPEKVTENEEVVDYVSEATLSESVVTNGPQAALLLRADTLRSQAQQQAQKRNALEVQRAAAFREGRFADAFALKHERDEAEELAEKLNEKARRRYYQAHNAKPQDPFTIDVHRHNVQEAVRVTEKALRDIQRNGGKLLHVIVGRGLHSPGRVPILRNAVLRTLSDQGLLVRINKRNPGLLDVELPYY